MGSLMAGWDSPIHENPDSAVMLLGGKRSRIRKEIEKFWKLKKKSGGGDGGCTVNAELWSTTSSSSADSPKSSNLSETYSNKPIEIKLGDWWRRSNLAFLNETRHEKVDDHVHRSIASFDVTCRKTR